MRTSERGTTLVETMIALALLLVVITGLLSLVALATTYTENQGHLGARTTEYAQDKMEQLLALAYGDAVGDTTTTDPVLSPTAPTGGTGLQVGGSVVTAAPVNGYVDWLAYDGSPLGGGTVQPSTWFYERVWQITCVSAPCNNNPPTGIKQITVTATVRSSVGGAMIPISSVVALKASQF